MLEPVAKKSPHPFLARVGASFLSRSDFSQTLIEVVGTELAWVLLSHKVVWV